MPKKVCWTCTRSLFHKYTASSYGLGSFPRKRASRRRVPWGLDARLRGHDVLLASDLRNRHLGWCVDTRKISIAEQRQPLQRSCFFVRSMRGSSQRECIVLRRALTMRDWHSSSVSMEHRRLWASRALFRYRCVVRARARPHARRERGLAYNLLCSALGSHTPARATMIT